MLTTALFYFTPVGLTLWIIVAMWHMRRQHQIREKSTALAGTILCLLLSTGCCRDRVIVKTEYVKPVVPQTPAEPKWYPVTFCTVSMK